MREVITQGFENLARIVFGQGIHPGIVVGQLQKAHVIGYNKLNELIERYEKSIVDELSQRISSGSVATEY